MWPFFWEWWVVSYLFSENCLLICWPHHTQIVIKLTFKTLRASSTSPHSPSLSLEYSGPNLPNSASQMTSTNKSAQKWNKKKLNPSPNQKTKTHQKIVKQEFHKPFIAFWYWNAALLKFVTPPNFPGKQKQRARNSLTCILNRVSLPGIRVSNLKSSKSKQES